LSLDKDKQIDSLNTNIGSLKTSNESLKENVDSLKTKLNEQEIVINGLKKLLCEQNPKAEICQEK
jgi:uncharacterized coiled-coil protein SlyX